MKFPALESLQNIPGSLVVDGTLIPVWNWSSQGRTLFSGQHKRTGYNHQVICTLSGKLLAITDPVPGARDDVYAYHFHQLERFLNESTLADKGYIGLGLLTSTKRKPGVRMRAAVSGGEDDCADQNLAGSVLWFSAAVGFLCAGVFFWCGGCCFILLGPLTNKPLYIRICFD